MLGFLYHVFIDIPATLWDGGPADKFTAILWYGIIIFGIVGACGQFS